MARKIIDIGIVGNDGTGDSIRDSFRKVNENFYEVYGSLGLGERLQLTNLGDTPDGYEGFEYVAGEDPLGITAVATLNDPTDPSGLTFKKLKGGEGVIITYPAAGNEILIGVDFSAIYSQELLAESIRLGDGSSISNFSTDSTFAANATSKIPVERAVRSYIDKRLGVDHNGTIVPSNERIPNQGGFLPLSGQLSMQGNINLEDPYTPGTFYKITNLEDATDVRDAVNLQTMTQAIDAMYASLNPSEYQIENANILADAGIEQSKLDLTLASTSASAPTGTVAEVQAANGVASFDSTYFTASNGWISINDNSIAYNNLQTVGARTLLGNDTANPGNVVEISLDDVLTGGSDITNTNIASDAAITQDKLSLNIAPALANNPSGTAEDIQAANGVASFNSEQFSVVNGRATIDINGINLDRLRIINARTLLGNPGFAPGNVSEVPFNDIVDDGGAVKKSQYNTLGFLRRKNSTSNVLDIDYEIIDMSVDATSNTLIKRDANADFSARIANLSQLQIDSQTILDTQVILAGGAVRLYGWQGAGGIMLQGGPNATDKATYYDNDAHKFRNQAGTAYAPVRAGSIETTEITTGSETTPGTIEGYWSLVGDSRLESTYSADLAEYYEGDKEYPQGTVLIFGGEKEVTVSNKQMDTRIAGVVSCDAAFAMYKACPGHKNLIALQGRVPCRVVGKIAKGDLLVTASIPGVAISAKDDAKAGTIIGKSLENYDSDHIGMIQVAVGRA